MMWGLVFQIMPPFHSWSAKKVRIYTLGKQILLHCPNIRVMEDSKVVVLLRKGGGVMHIKEGKRNFR